MRQEHKDAFQFVFRDLPCSDQRSHQGEQTPEPASHSRASRRDLVCSTRGAVPNTALTLPVARGVLLTMGTATEHPAHLRSVPSQQNPARRDLEKTRREEPCTLWKKQINSRPPPNTLDLHV